MSSAEGRSYVFNYENQPSSITKNSSTYNYFYDEEGIRFKKSNGVVTTLFVDKLVEIKDGSPFYHIFHGDKRVASIDGSEVLTFNHADHLGSSNFRTNSTGAQVKRIEYYPFGSKRENLGTYDEIKFNYTGQYEDSETDLLYYNARYYDPVLGRFISADKLYLEEMDKRGVNGQELNVFAYVGNNPIIKIDPTGQSGSPFDIPGEIAKFTFVEAAKHDYKVVSPHLIKQISKVNGSIANEKSNLSNLKNNLKTNHSNLKASRGNGIKSRISALNKVMNTKAQIKASNVKINSLRQNKVNLQSRAQRIEQMHQGVVDNNNNVKADHNSDSGNNGNVHQVMPDNRL